MKAFKRDSNEYIILALNTKDDLGIFKRNGIPVSKELVGSFKGVEESSYMVNNSESALLLAQAFKQESVVVLSELSNSRREASVLKLNQFPFKNSQTGIKGEFKNVGHNKPTQDCWTFDIETGNYFVII